MHLFTYTLSNTLSFALAHKHLLLLLWQLRWDAMMSIVIMTMLLLLFCLCFCCCFCRDVTAVRIGKTQLAVIHICTTYAHIHTTYELCCCWVFFRFSACALNARQQQRISMLVGPFCYAEREKEEEEEENREPEAEHKRERGRAVAAAHKLNLNAPHSLAMLLPELLLLLPCCCLCGSCSSPRLGCCCCCLCCFGHDFSIHSPSSFAFSLGVARFTVQLP